MAKFIISFKNPDAIDCGIQDANLSEKDAAKAKAVCQKYFEYGEYANIEIDTDKGTATLLKKS
jgi:hypothetical protein